MQTSHTQCTAVADKTATRTRTRTVSMAFISLAGLAAIVLAMPSLAQRYLSERVVKGVQVQASIFQVSPGFTAVRTGSNEITVRQAKDAKSVEGKLECDCSGAKKGAECGVDVVKDQIVCKGAGCEGGTCKVRAASGWRLQ